MNKLCSLILAISLTISFSLARADQAPEEFLINTKSSFAYVMDHSDLFLYYLHTLKVIGLDVQDYGTADPLLPESIDSYFSCDFDYCYVYCDPQNAHITGLGAVLFDSQNSEQQNYSCIIQLMAVMAALEYDSISEDSIKNHILHGTEPAEITAIEAIWDHSVTPALLGLYDVGSSVLLYRSRYNYYATLTTENQIVVIALCDDFQFDDNTVNLHASILRADITDLQQAKAAASDSSEAGRIEIALLRKQLELAELLYQ